MGMDVLALILACVAVIVFLIDIRPATRTYTLVPIGLALLAASWICQATSLTDHWVNL